MFISRKREPSSRKPKNEQPPMSPLCAAGMRCGTAGASALRMVSITVGSAMLHRPSADGGLALSMVPSGRIDFERRGSSLR